MNEIKLNKLTLRDFQGGTVSLEADGNDVFIFAANAVGKTRLVSAFTWLLFGKDALGRSDFEIKNLDAEGAAAHGLEHTVWADLLVDGKLINLQKVYHEIWSKKRGSAERTFSGHTVEYSVDGVPTKEKDYLSRIAEIAGDESRFRLLTSPSVFPALHWQAQRKLLLEICGDVSDVDVIVSDEKLSPLTAILGKHSLDDHRKIVIGRRSEINKEMEKIPIRIDEVHRGIPETAGIDQKASEKEVKRLETALNDAKLRLQGLDTGGNIAELSKKIAGLNADLRKMEDAHRSESMSTINRLNQQISEIGVKVGADRRRVQAIEEELKAKESTNKGLGSNLIRLREQWVGIDAEKFLDPIAEYCPVCGQSLPFDKVQEARDKAIGHFNQRKAERLGEIDRKGKELREQSDRLFGEVDALKKEKEIIATTLLDAETNLKTLTDERDTLKESSEDFSGIPHWSETFGEIEAYEQEIKAEREGKAQDIEKIKEERAALQGKLTVAKDHLDKFTRREQGEKRIEELKTEEKKLSAEFEKLEGELYLTDLFVKTKVSLLTDRINAKFDTVRWRLFENLINGGVNEVCEMTIGGVGYSSGLNNAARIQGGLEIVRVLQEHYGLRCPIFIDNRESVSEIPKLNCQVISLVVSPEDKHLRVEVNNEKPTDGQYRSEVRQTHVS